MALRILIADDHEAVRLGLRDILSKKARLEVCGEATDGEDAVLKVRDLMPDVVILDLTMPAMNGFDAAREIRRISPFTRIIFFSMHEVPVNARETGADVFISKSAPMRELLNALDDIAAKVQQAIPDPASARRPKAELA